MRDYILITGLCCSGKTTYAKKFGYNILYFDEIYNYNTTKLSYETIDKHIDNSKGTIYMDAYNEDLINYIKERDERSVFSVIFIQI